MAKGNKYQNNNIIYIKVVTIIMKMKIIILLVVFSKIKDKIRIKSYKIIKCSIINTIKSRPVVNISIKVQWL